MKSTKRWYFPQSLETETQISMNLVLGIVFVLGLCLAHEGGEARKLEKENRLLYKALNITNEQNNNMEKGLLDCVSGQKLHVVFPDTDDFADVDCKKVITSVWDHRKKKVNKK